MIRFNFLSLLLLGCLLAVASVGQAEVTSAPWHGTAQKYSTIAFPLTLASPQAVAGVNGQLNFDTTFFTNPRIELAQSSPNFIALGNEVSAGHFKFVIYPDPTVGLDLSRPVARFVLDVKTAPASTLSLLTYEPSLSAASDLSGVSLAATFADVDYMMNANAAKDWAIYE